MPYRRPAAATLALLLTALAAGCARPHKPQLVVEPVAGFTCPGPYTQPRPAPVVEVRLLERPPSLLGCATQANLAAMVANPADLHGRRRYPLVEGNRAIEPVSELKRNAGAAGTGGSGAAATAGPAPAAAQAAPAAP
jgi:type IV pilus biogenesis protein CpaD/CtpE